MKKAAWLLGGTVLVVGGAALCFRDGAEPPAPQRGAVAAPSAAGTQRDATPLPSDAAALHQLLERTPEPASRRELVRRAAASPEGLAELKAVYGLSRDGAVREEILTVTAKAGSPEAVQWLADVAGGADPMAARAGAALGSVTEKGAAEALGRLASGTGPVVVRANAVRALGTTGDATQEALLLRLLKSGSESQRVRQEAALSLGGVGGESAVPELAALLAAPQAEGPAAEQLRISIIEGLSGIGGPKARAVLEQHARRPLGPNERAFVDRALKSR